MTGSQDQLEEWSVNDFPFTSTGKKEKKEKHNAESPAVMEARQSEDLGVPGDLPARNSEGRKRKRKHRISQLEDSEIIIKLMQSILKPEESHKKTGPGVEEGSAPESVAVTPTWEDADLPSKAKKSSRRGAVKNGGGEGAAGDSDVTAFQPKKHKKDKLKTHLAEKEPHIAEMSEDGAGDSLGDSPHTRKSHKKSKTKALSAEGENVPSEAKDAMATDHMEASSQRHGTRPQGPGEDGSTWHTDHAAAKNDSEYEFVETAIKGKKKRRRERMGSMKEKKEWTPEGCPALDDVERSVKKKKHRRPDGEQAAEQTVLEDSSKSRRKHKKNKRKMDTAEGEDNTPRTTANVSDAAASERPVKTKKKHRTTAELGEQDTRTAEENCSRKTEKKKKRKEREQVVSTENETQASIALDCIGQRERGDAREAGTRSSGELTKEKPAWKSSEDGGVTAETGAEEADCRAQEGLDVTLGEEDILPEGLMDASERAVAEEVEDLDAASRSQYETAVQLLKEFIPKIRNVRHSKVMEMVKFDLPRFLSFKEQGIAVRYGRFTAEENEQIKTNMAEYMALTGIDSADKVLHTDRYPEQAVAIRELKKEHRLCHYIATGIARPWSLVLSRASKIFDPFNYKGRYSKEEIDELKRYHATCGNSWMQIANCMSRSNLSVALKFSQLRNPTNHGHWSKAERRRLVHAVEDVILSARSPEELESMASAMEQSSSGQIPTLVREQLYKGITWVEVEAKVKTRNWMQCKLKWNDYLTKRMTGGVRVYQGLSALQAKIKLIQRLYTSQVEDSNDIDWEELAECIGNVPPAYAQMKFYKLKANYVPSWHIKTFPEIVDYLYEVKLPVFEARLEKMKEKKKLEEEEMPAREKQKVFRITDIFQDSDSEGSEPEDN